MNPGQALQRVERVDAVLAVERDRAPRALLAAVRGLDRVDAGLKPRLRGVHLLLQSLGHERSAEEEDLDRHREGDDRDSRMADELGQPAQEEQEPEAQRAEPDQSPEKSSRPSRGSARVNAACSSGPDRTYSARRASPRSSASASGLRAGLRLEVAAHSSERTSMAQKRLRNPAQSPGAEPVGSRLSSPTTVRTRPADDDAVIRSSIAAKPAAGGGPARGRPRAPASSDRPAMNAAAFGPSSAPSSRPRSRRARPRTTSPGGRPDRQVGLERHDPALVLGEIGGEAERAADPPADRRPRRISRTPGESPAPTKRTDVPDPASARAHDGWQARHSTGSRRRAKAGDPDARRQPDDPRAPPVGARRARPPRTARTEEQPAAPRPYR